MSIQSPFRVMMALNQGTYNPCPKLQSLQSSCSHVFKIQALGRLPTLKLQRYFISHYQPISLISALWALTSLHSAALGDLCYRLAPSMTPNSSSRAMGHKKVPLHCTVGLGGGLALFCN